MRAPYQDRPAAKRRVRFMRPRPTTFEWIAPTAGAQLAGMTGHGNRIVYVVGPRPKDSSSWVEWALAGVRPDWAVEHYYGEGATPIIRYRSCTAADLTVEVHHADAWFGGGAYTPDRCAHAWSILEAGIARAFEAYSPRAREIVPAQLLSTAATTGRELWLRTIPSGVEYPALDDDMQSLLRSTLGQARIEGPDTLLAGDDRPELAGLHEYDGRFMYAALCWESPIGTPTHDTLDQLDAPYAQARYLVTLEAPAEWPHNFGVVGVKRDDGATWEYPTKGAVVAWCDGAELLVATNAGWHLRRIHERIVFPGADAPLRTWARKLAQLRRVNADRLVQVALRQILLAGIGAFQGRPHQVTRLAPIDDPGVDVPMSRARLEGDHFVWSEAPADSQPEWSAALSHPEWCAAVWGKARARLLDAPAGPGWRAGALHADGPVVAFRTDAIYTERRQAWPDDLHDGRYRLRRTSTGPVATPRTSAELLRLRRTLDTVDAT